MQNEYSGSNGTVVLTDRAIIIKRNFLRGDKTIPYSSVVAVQLKKAGMMTAGYIQFTLAGGSEAKGWLLEAAMDENTIMFNKSFKQSFRFRSNDDDEQNKKFAECKRLVEERMGHGGNAPSAMDEIAKLADLKSKGVITEDEFSAKKKQLLGL